MFNLQNRFRREPTQFKRLFVVTFPDKRSNETRKIGGGKKTENSSLGNADTIFLRFYTVVSEWF